MDDRRLRSITNVVIFATWLKSAYLWLMHNWPEKRLLNRFQGNKGGRQGEQSDVQPVLSSSATTMNYEHITESSKHLPTGLVGEPKITQIRVDGYPCMGLLDSGSQVTCVGEYFLRKYLPTKQFLPLSDLVVTGAVVQDVPYLGYLQLDILVDRKEAELNVTESTLALVTPGGDDQSMVIIGTNTAPPRQKGLTDILIISR